MPKPKIHTTITTQEPSPLIEGEVEAVPPPAAPEGAPSGMALTLPLHPLGLGASRGPRKDTPSTERGPRPARGHQRRGGRGAGTPNRAGRRFNSRHRG